MSAALLTGHVQSPPHSQADLAVASGGVHQVDDKLVRLPGDHVFIHRDELVPRAESAVALGGGVLDNGADHNLFGDNGGISVIGRSQVAG